MEIEFIPSSLEVYHFLDIPPPAKNNIPDWYKKLDSFEISKMYNKSGDTINNKLKMCMPFFDAISGGYVQKTWCEISIKKVSDGIKIEIPDVPGIVGTRNLVSLPLNHKEYYNLEFFWINPWILKLPKGYSALITHPFNRLDLPFSTTSGIVDSDVFYHSGFGQVPFYLKNDFEGIIPIGTPMFQILPIKRDSWTSVKKEFNELEQRKRSFQLLRTFWQNYKNNFWSKKSYD